MAYFESTNLKDSSGSIVNPASEDSIVLLRRIMKLLEAQAAVDPQQRQRVTIDNMTSGLTLTTVSGVTTVSTVTTVSAVTTVSTVSSVTNIAALNGWNQQMFVDPARNAYNTGIRERLTFA